MTGSILTLMNSLGYAAAKATPIMANFKSAKLPT
jgi:hypothetical protein